MKSQEDYNLMAIDWVEQYIANNKPLFNVKVFDGILMENTHYTLTYWVYRLKNSKGRDQYGSFAKIKKFKDWHNKQTQL